MKKYFDSLISSSGRPISGASITVYTSGTASLASLFSTSSGTALTNPVTSNSSGYFEFYAADGRYDLTISSSGYGSQSVTDILLEDPADANSAVINGGTINGTTIGATTPSTGAFTTLSATGNTTLGSASTDTVTVSGNVGVGVTPSAWGAAYIATQSYFNTSYFVSNAGAAGISSNAYHNGTNWIRGNPSLSKWYEFGTNSTIFKWSAAAAGTAGEVLTSAQVMAVGLGTTLALEGATSAAGTGIAFPATQLASSNANTLDDYEEGVFTPTIAGTTVAGTGTYSTQVGRYTKVGNRVFVTVNLVWSAHTGTGDLLVSSLPFTSGSGGDGRAAFSLYFSSLTFTGAPMAIMSDASASMSLLTATSGASTIGIPMDASAGVEVSGHYQV